MVYNAGIDSYRQNITYNVAIYARLSREDENRNGESESIQNQKDYCTKYVLEKGWNIVDYYCDDGYTGTNFERPAFKRLLKDIENNKVNVVITKDLSRLGRDYIGTGNYLERFFPENRIRYIAVNDGIDTFSDSSNNDMSPFRSVINDMYARDISKKVRAVMNTKRENGEFIGAFAPYGYKKHPNNNNKLIIDDNVVSIVKKIFKMYINGFGFSKIAHILNDEEVLCPGAYKKQQNNNYNNPKTKLNLWTAQTVRSILINPTYAGNLTQNKYYKTSHKGKKVMKLPKECWVTIQNTHEPIIDNETFEFVQKMIVNKTSVGCSSNKAEHLLSGLIFCGDCGERMTFTKTQKGIYYCICSKYKRFKRCTRHSINEKDLEKYIISELKKISSRAVNQDKLIKMANAKGFKTKKEYLKNEKGKTQDKLRDINKKIKSLYEDKLKGIITEKDFIYISKDYNIEREKLDKLLEKFKEEEKEFESLNNENDKLLAIVNELMNFKKIDKAIILKLIEKIEIFENERIVIHYKFKRPFKN